MEKKMDFESVWSTLQEKLKADTKIKNWTAYRGYLGDSMKIISVRTDCIELDAPGAINTQRIPKVDFMRVWDVWADYKSQKVKRYELRDMTRYSKYIISILHWYEDDE